MAEPAPTRLHLYTDGASQGNPGPSAAAWLIVDPATGEVLEETGEYLGAGTNNVAEYTAIVRGLAACLRLGAGRVEAFSDSNFCLKQINGVYRVKKPHLRPLYEEVQRLRTSFEGTRFTWVPRTNEWIERCDKLAEGIIERHSG